MVRDYPLQMGVKTRATPMEVSMESPKNARNRSKTWVTYTTLGHKAKGLHILLLGYLHIYVHYSFIHNSQKVEIAQISLSWEIESGNAYTIYYYLAVNKIRINYETHK